MANPSISTWVARSALALVLVAASCGAEADEPVPDPTDASPASSAAALPGAGAPIAEGRYAANVFDGPIAFDVGPGWRMDVEELRHGIFLAREEHDVYASVLRPTHVFEITDDGMHGPPLDAPASAQALVDHLVALPVGGAGAEPADVGGLGGFRARLDASDLSSVAAMDGERAVLLAAIPADPLDREPISLWLSEGRGAEILAIDAGDTPVLVVVDGPMGSDEIGRTLDAFAGSLEVMSAADAG